MGTAFQDSLLEDTLAIGSNLSTHVNVFAPHTTLKQNPTPLTTQKESRSTKSVILNVHLGISCGRWG